MFIPHVSRGAYINHFITSIVFLFSPAYICDWYGSTHSIVVEKGIRIATGANHANADRMNMWTNLPGDGGHRCEIAVIPTDVVARALHIIYTSLPFLFDFV